MVLDFSFIEEELWFWAPALEPFPEYREEPAPVIVDINFRPDRKIGNQKNPYRPLIAAMKWIDRHIRAASRK